MHRIPADYVSLFFRALKWDAEERGVGFRVVLKEVAKARVEGTSEGLALIGTATDGSSVNYSLPSPSAGMSLSPETLALMIGRIWDWVDEIVAVTPAITDDALLVALRARNVPVRSFRSNFRTGVY